MLGCEWNKQYFYCKKVFFTLLISLLKLVLWATSYSLTLISASHEVDYDDEILCYHDNLWGPVSPHLC